MTVATSNNREEYVGNGSTKAFSFPNKFFADSDLLVYLVEIATNTAVLQTLDTDYTVTGAGDEAGGTVTFVTAPASTHNVVIYRDLAITQPIDMVNGDAFDVDTTVEKMADRSTMQIQRNRELALRAMRRPETEIGDLDMELPNATERASKFLAFDASGEPIASSGTLVALAAETVMQPVDTVADLKDVAIPGAAVAMYVRGHYSAGDGGHRIVYWDVSSTDTADDGLTILPTGHTGAGRWKTFSIGAVDLKIFGAKYDGETDDSAAVDAAVATGRPLIVSGPAIVAATKDWTGTQFYFTKSGKFSVSGEHTLTLDHVYAGKYQIFSWDVAESITLAKPCPIAYPEWFGAVGDGTVNDGASVAEAVYATGASGVLLEFSQVYAVGETIAFVNTGNYRATGGAQIKSYSSYANGPTLSDGNWSGHHTLPKIYGFSSYGLKLLGSNLADIELQTIESCGDALVLDTATASYANCLDNRIYVHQIGNCTRAVVFRADDAANAIQGNEICGNFINNITADVVLYDDTGAAAAIGWTANVVHFQAIDLVSNANTYVLRSNSAYNVNNATMIVETWLGGWAATSKVISGKFFNLKFRGKLSGTTGLPYNDMVALTSGAGSSNDVQFELSQAINTEFTAQAAAGSRASFNSGLAATYRKMYCNYTIPGGGLADGATLTLYVYHQCTDGASNNFVATPGTGVGNGNGIIIDRVYDNSAVNASEIIVVVRNVRGTTIAAAEVIRFTVEQV